jgi:hypothetical protein
LVSASNSSSQARSLNWQRRSEGSLREQDAQSWLGGGVGVELIGSTSNGNSVEIAS